MARSILIGRAVWMRRRKPRTSGFSLIELLVVISVVVVLIAIAVPAYQRSIVHTRETALREDLFNIREAISRYGEENEEPPQSLDDLVSKGYLASLPIDPMTNSRQTWKPVSSQTSDDPVSAGEADTPSGVVDVHSGSDLVGSDGKPYSEW